MAGESNELAEHSCLGCRHRRDHRSVFTDRRTSSGFNRRQESNGSCIKQALKQSRTACAQYELSAWKDQPRVGPLQTCHRNFHVIQF